MLVRDDRTSRKTGTNTANEPRTLIGNKPTDDPEQTERSPKGDRNATRNDIDVRTHRRPKASEHGNEHKVTQHRSETELLSKEDRPKLAQRLTLDRKLIGTLMQGKSKKIERRPKRHRGETEIITKGN